MPTTLPVGVVYCLHFSVFAKALLTAARQGRNAWASGSNPPKILQSKGLPFKRDFLPLQLITASRVWGRQTVAAPLIVA